MRIVLTAYKKASLGDEHRLAAIGALLELASGRYHGHAVDRGALADWWLRAIQPVKFKHLGARARKRPVLLKDLRADLIRNPLETSTLERVFDAPLLARPIDERVVAAIVGVA